MLIDKRDLKVTLKHLSNTETLYRKTSSMSYSIQLTIVGLFTNDEISDEI